MKKIILVVSLILVSAVGYCDQPFNLGTIKVKKLAFDPYTAAQIDQLTPDTTNQFVMCGNCVRTTVCKSSGTGKGAWVIAVATGQFVGANQSGFDHCQ